MGPGLLQAFGMVVVSYLIGSIPFGLLVGRAKGVDIRTKGSGNIGATNVGRVLGRGYGMAVFALDMLKGFTPTFAAGLWLASWDEGLAAGDCLLWVAVAAGCIFGHVFSVYLGFRGGKGVATSLGVLLGVYPYFTWAGLMVFGLWIVLTLVTRYVSVGSVVAVGVFPVVFAAMAYWHRANWGTIDRVWPLHVFAVVAAGLVIYRHRGNIGRLMAGTESKIGGSGSAGQ